MDESLKKQLAADTDGLLTYGYIANHIDNCDDILPELVDTLMQADKTGQCCVSAARYLHAVSADKYASQIGRLCEGAIERDREHRYLADLLSSLWGADYAEHAAELSASDNNFRRIYKRLYPKSVI